MTQPVSSWLPSLIGPVVVADEGTAVPARGTINFTGAGVAVTDNPGSSRTDVTISGGGSSIGLGTALQVLRTNAAGLATEWATPTVIPLALANIDASGGTNGQVLTRTAGVVAWATPAAGAASTGGAGQLDVSDGAGGWTAATTILAGAGFISIGATPATAGTVRLPYVAADTIIGAKDSGGTDRAILSRSSADTIRLGHQTAYNVGVWASGLELWGNATITLEAGAGAAVPLFSSGTTAECGLPQIGYAAASSPYGRDGTGPQAMVDANQTAAAAVYKYGTIMPTGAITANRTLTIPAGGAVNASGYQKMISNACTGAFSIVVSTGAGTTVTIANGKSALVIVDSRGVTRGTPDA